jgi:WD40 repeat protein
MKARVLLSVLLVAAVAAPGWCQADKPDPREMIAFKLQQKGLKPGRKTSPNGKLGVRVKGLTAQVYDIATGKAIGPPLKHNQRRKDTRITAWTFSPDGKTLATGTGDPAGRAQHDSAGEVQVWDIASGKSLVAVSDMNADVGYVNALAFTRDGMTVLVDCDEISGK